MTQTIAIHVPANNIAAHTTSGKIKFLDLFVCSIILIYLPHCNMTRSANIPKNSSAKYSNEYLYSTSAR